MTAIDPSPSAADRQDRARRLTSGIARLYPYEGHFLDRPGGALHYLDEGPRSTSAIVCVHGNPTWSFYWRKLVEAFRGAHRVVVPDHLGMGLSDRPGRDVRLEEHVENLAALVDHLGLEDATLVCHDWGGAIGMGAALARRRVFSRFVVTNTAAFPSSRIPRRIAACRIPFVGRAMVERGNAFAGAAVRMAVTKPLEEDVKRGLLAPYGSAAERRQVAAFVHDIPMSPKHPSWSTLCGIADSLTDLRGLPMAIAWGDRDWCFDGVFRAGWEQRFPKARVMRSPEAGHYLMEDDPDLVIEATRFVLCQNPLGGQAQ